LAACTGCASFDQKESEVYKRETGGRLENWKSAAEASSLHLPYAWAAVAAYQDSDDPARKRLVVTEACPEPHAFLEGNDWTLWNTLPLMRTKDIKFDPESPLATDMRDVHLRAEVWENQKRNEVIVAFGGTAAASMQDWKSNFRWFLAPFKPNDAYTVLTDKYVPAFINEYKRRSNISNGEWLKLARITSVGHSLGGRLAQRFAYSLNPEEGILGVKTVYAFDPSPVSGKRSVVGYKETAHGLTIFRVYKRGEALASMRSLLQWSNRRPSKDGQTWTDLRYRDGWSWKTLLPSGSVSAHGMYRLACFMKGCTEGKCVPEETPLTATK
jgi:hypothetical protein